MKKIGVLLPVYYGDKLSYLRDSIESLKHQTINNFDIYLLIDGPIKKEVQEFLKENQKYPRLKIVSFKKNHGLGFVLNYGVSLLLKQGYYYIVRMDADDISLSNRLETQLAFMEKNPQIDVIGGHIQEIDENNNLKKLVKYPLTHEECFNFFKYRDPIAHPAAFFRRSFFEKAGNYEKMLRKNQDTYLWYKGFLFGCKFANVDSVVIKFRLTKDTLKRRGNIKQLVQFYKLRKEINKNLGYGMEGNFYLMLNILLKLSPFSIRKFAYKFLR